MAEAVMPQINLGNHGSVRYEWAIPGESTIDIVEEDAPRPTRREELLPLRKLTVETLVCFDRGFDHVQSLQRELLRRFENQLQAAYEEAEAMGDEGITALKPQARDACIAIGTLAAERCFYLEGLQLVATAKINGGAVFVGRNPKTSRRIDVEIGPDGSSAELVATERAQTVSASAYDLDKDVFDSWLHWLLRP